MHISIRQLFTLDTVVKKGSFKAAAETLHRSHPSIMATVKKLEEQLGFDVFDRNGYRVVLTHRGSEFYRATFHLLENYSQLRNKVETLQRGNGQHINIAVGDITPPALVIKELQYFSKISPETQLNLFSGNLMGPQELLLDNKVDIIFHSVDQFDARIEVVPLGKVTIVPVVAPGYIRSPVNEQTSYTALKSYTQCIIRCTAMHNPSKDYFIVDDSKRLTVGDQLTKKQIIMSGLAWGYLPDYLIKNELDQGLLKSIAGKNIKEGTLTIVAARMINCVHRDTAQLFWEFLKKIRDHKISRVPAYEN